MKSDADIFVYDRTARAIAAIEESIITLLMVASEEADRRLTRDEALTAFDKIQQEDMFVIRDEILVTVDDHSETSNREHLEGYIRSSETDVRHVFVSASGDGIDAVVETALQNNVITHMVPISVNNSIIDDVTERRAGVGEEWSGRPPLGFEVQAGQLVRSENYEQVANVLRAVDNGDLSKRAAADELDTSRRTIGRALDNRERYL
jgi:hypothetical protein